MGDCFITIHSIICMFYTHVCMLYITILNKVRSIPLFLSSVCSIFIEQMQNFTHIDDFFLFLTYLSGCFYIMVLLLILQNVCVSGSKGPETSVFCRACFVGVSFLICLTGLDNLQGFFQL